MSKGRTALGRGLGALIQTPTTGASRAELRTDEARAPSGVPLPVATPEPRPAELRVSDIDPNPEQPRRHFEPESLETLANSIALHGVLQPIVVRRSGDRFELIMGERRWRASQQAGLETIPAVVSDVDTSERLELAIVENVQRQDLNPIELAYAYRALADAGHTQAEIGAKVSMDRSSVANHLRLLELSRELQEDVENGRITMGHAKALLQVADPEQRRALRDRVVSDHLSVRDAEQMGRRLAGPAPSRRPRKPKSEAPVDADTRALLDSFQQRFQTRVTLQRSGSGGRIEISFHDLEELDRLTQLLLGRG